MHTRSGKGPRAGEAGSTSLDDSETTQHPLMTQSRAQRAIHAAVWDVRAHVIEAMHTSDRLGHDRRAERMGMCCVSPSVFVEAGRDPVCVPGRCRDRLCPTCQRVRGREVRRRLDTLLAKADAVRLLTLTQPATKDTLGQRVDSLLAAFRSLRRRAAWRKHVTGGVAVVEITRGAKGDHWHVHLHALVEGSFWPQKSIANEWSEVLGKPGIVDIRAVHARHGAARYVTKYAAKGTELGEWDHETIRDYACGVHRRRLLATFGKWARVDVNRDEDEAKTQPLPRVEVSYGLVRAAIEADTRTREHAAPLLARLGVMWRLLMSEFCDVQSVATTDIRGDEVESLVSLMLQLSGADVPPAPCGRVHSRAARPPDPLLFRPPPHV